MSEMKKEYNEAYDIYLRCVMKCDTEIPKKSLLGNNSLEFSPLNSYPELRGELLLRIAVINKEFGNPDEAMRICDRIYAETSTYSLSTGLCTRSLCLKVMMTSLFVMFIFSCDV
jgi:hypothetical protein